MVSPQRYGIPRETKFIPGKGTYADQLRRISQFSRNFVGRHPTAHKLVYLQKVSLVVQGPVVYFYWLALGRRVRVHPTPVSM